jgi:hypothetical protein
MNTLLTQSIIQMASETKAGIFTSKTQEDIIFPLVGEREEEEEEDEAPSLVTRAIGIYEQRYKKI